MLSTEKLYDLLLQHMGPQNWWPADSELEMIIGAILVQNTSWRNVAISLERLNEATAFKHDKLLALSTDELETLIRSSGFHKNKSKAIKGILEWLNQHGFDYPAIKAHYGDSLRSELLKLRGIGPETADVLRVYLFHEAVFIPDSYTRRLYKKLGYQNTETYEKFKKEVTIPEYFTSEDAKEFHGLLDEFGKLYLSRTSDKKHFLSDYFVEEDV